ncbi:MAG TPA: hypothetical protein VNJ29_00160, partial [Candidatus Nitrosotenuis sp.]|nr:hypothetical protein [Candidatus Nitrosotenuis sp.]
RKIDPMTLLDNFKTEGKLNTTDLTIPPGKYAMPFMGTFWHQNSTRSELEAVNPRGQGWKIHISALPHSAKKIASLILPEINNLPHQKGPRVFYKIIGSLPLMRTMWYVYGKVKGQESQVGKFLVIYPDNGAHAYELVKKIDNILVSAKKRGLLKDSDFIPLLGDAQVGYSGWVYVRYGGLTVHQVKKLDPMEATMQLGEESSIELFQDDDRFHPWPDFMNKGNMFWKSQPNPFYDLPLKWTPINKRKVITWENRPNSWFELDNTEDELSDLKESFAVFDKKFQEEAIRQQIESDRLLAEKIHLEEVAKYEEEQKQIREDEEFARKLQQEELKRGA